MKLPKSLRSDARQFAEDAMQRATDGFFGLIERRIEWRREHPHLLALEAERMVYLLERQRSFVAFRKWRLVDWRARHRKWAARAWAADQQLAAKCGLGPCPAA